MDAAMCESLLYHEDAMSPDPTSCLPNAVGGYQFNIGAAQYKCIPACWKC